jgi:hypothetical protein
MRAVLRQILETGDVVGTDASGGSRPWMGRRRTWETEEDV